MNRYRSGGPSKATATTLCQKCLKRGHYTYECTGTQQERPYTSRPSRSQQLLNPKLAPKLTATLPPVDTKPASKTEALSKSVTSSSLTESGSLTKERSDRPTTRRRRSISSHSSDSVSSYSTNRSRSISRTPPRASRVPDRSRDRSLSRSPVRSAGRRDRSPPITAARSGRRDLSASPDRFRRPARRESPDRMPRHRSRSPLHKDHRNEAQYRRRSRSRTRSPYRGDTRMPGKAVPERKETAPGTQARAPMRERSLSPYSQRLAMTKAMNG